MNNSIALIELSSSHDECLYSQVLFLKKAGIPVHLIVHEDLASRVKDYPAEKIVLLKSSRFKILKIIRYLIQNKIRSVVINTCTGNEVRNFTFLLPRKINLTGILHNGEKLNSTNSQNLISRRVKKYFVLNDYILKNIRDLRGITVQAMYPIYFNVQDKIIQKPDGEIWICIPGSLERKRRDYDSLIESLDPATLKGIKFLMLGRTKAESDDYIMVKSQLEKRGILDHFVFFFDFIDLPTFHAYLKRSDLIMPLIHPSKKEYESYKKFKISGSFNLAFAYKKPLLMEQTWQDEEDFKGTSVFYSLNNLPTVISEVRHSGLLLKIKDSYETMTKFDLGIQSAQYLSLVQKGS